MRQTGLLLWFLVVAGGGLVGSKPRAAWAQAAEDELLQGIADQPTTPVAPPASSGAAPDSPGAAPIGAAPATGRGAQGLPEGQTSRPEVFGPQSLDRLNVVARKRVRKTGRLEVTPWAAMSVGDRFFRHATAGGSLVYYPHDAFGIGVGTNYVLSDWRGYNVDLVRRGEMALLGRTDHPRLFAHADLYWVPVYGKAATVGDKIVYFDFYATAGFGAVQTAASAQLPQTTVALGQRYWISDWLAARVEIRDYFFVNKQQVLAQSRSRVQHYLLLLLGVSFYWPPSLDATNR